MRTFTRKYMEDGITYIVAHRGKYVLDNKNIQGDSLGMRRLKIRQSAKLYPLVNLVKTIVELIKLTKPNSWFVDSNGIVFRYVRSRNVKIFFRKIIKTKHIEELNKSLLYVKGLSAPLETTYNTRLDNKYVGLLKVKGTHIIYEFSDKKLKDMQVRL